MITLGLDIGTNSVGSAWVDSDKKIIEMGVGIFPAGIEDSDEKGRGEPKGRERRQARQIRRVLARRSARKLALKKFLIESGLLPADEKTREKLWETNPWHLRRKALVEALTPHEFGRVLVHLAQRRGAFGVHVRDEEEDRADEDDNDARTGKGKKQGADASADGKIKQAIANASKWRKGRTFGEAMADEYDARQSGAEGQNGPFVIREAIRNRRDSYERCADRAMIHEEFERIWAKQRVLQPAGTALAGKLADADFLARLDEPAPQNERARVFRHAGLIFEQRRTYWSVGTLGRCDLEPTDRCCPVADMHAQYFRVVETVNNLRLSVRGQRPRILTDTERQDVIARLRSQKTGSVAAVREALRIDKKTLRKKAEPEEFYRLNIEADAQREINTDRFHIEVVTEAIGEEEWARWDEKRREWVNRELLRLDPDVPGDHEKLRERAAKDWGLGEEKAESLVGAWRKRARGEARLKLSRRAILNLLPYMERQMQDTRGNDIWPTVTDARQAFATDPRNHATNEQRVRYAHWVSEELRRVLLEKCGGDLEAVERLLALRGHSAAERHYMIKHRGELPPPPMLSNPVVRKAIHEVRRHVNAYMAKFGCRPDRVVIELARDATQPKKLRDRELQLNRGRDLIRRRVLEEFELHGLSHTQREKAVMRVLLCRQQKEHCAYSGAGITVRDAANGFGPEGAVEIDHIIPQACGGGDDWSNKVLCYVKANRDKGRRSPVQWLSSAGFEKVEQIFEHLTHIGKKSMDPSGYFTAGDCLRKWENLHRQADAKALDWRPSQLTDTSYAATEVAKYLQAALYAEQPISFKKPREMNEGDSYARKIIFTKGRYTHKLRQDWRLFQRLKGGEGEALIKDRFDHRHHAIDAVVIACTNEAVLGQLGRGIREYDEARLAARERGEDADAVRKPAPLPVPKPWEDVGEFRHAVMARLFETFDACDEAGKANGEAKGRDGLSWAVSHRPRKRKIVGALHQATQYGPVQGCEGRFTYRVAVSDLKPGYLKLSTKQRVDERCGKCISAADDPAIDRNSYLVRDIALRIRLREALRQEGLDPDQFTGPELKPLVLRKKIRMSSGVPIHSVVCLKTISNPVRIRRSDDTREDRIYVAGNNHHLEIRETPKQKWVGTVTRMYEAAARKSAQLRAIRANVKATDGAGIAADARRAVLHQVRREAMLANPIVDRRDAEQGRFIMSLAEGEMLRMINPKSGRPGLYVVFQLDPGGAIHACEHFDARRDGGEKVDGEVVPGSKRDEVIVGAAELRELGLRPGEPPRKVRVSALGEIHVLERD